MEMASFATGLVLGIESSNKKISSAERDISSGKGKVIINYVDGSIYTMECDRTETDNKITLTNVTETWTKSETAKE